MKLPLKLTKPQIDRLLVLLLFGALSLACDRFVHISGQIRDATGRPIGGASVKLFVTSANLTPQPSSSPQHRATSDDTGHYNVGDADAPMRLSFLLVVEKEGYRPFQKALAEPPNPIENISLQPLTPTGKESLIESHDVGNGLKLFVPKTSAETKYFPAISQFAKAAKLNDLRANPLPADESEVRIWTGFGKSPLKGYVIRRGKADFARFVQASSGPDNVTVSDLAPTDGDWFETWRKLTAEGLLSLPDFSQLPAGVDESGLKNSETIVFESSADGIYRVYYYPAVNAQTWPEAKRAIQIVKSLKTYYKPEYPK
jgi:hypothetical protein